APGPVREAAGVKGPRGGFAAGVLLFVVGLLVAAQIHLSGGRVMNVPINDYWLSELEQSACYFLAIIGLNLALGYTGLFSFAHVSLFAMGAYGSAIAVTHHGLPVWAGIPIGTAVGALAGAILSLATFRARATTF